VEHPISDVFPASLGSWIRNISRLIIAPPGSAVRGAQTPLSHPMPDNGPMRLSSHLMNRSSHGMPFLQALFEAITVAMTFNDVALMRDAIEQRPRELWIAKHFRPARKFQIGGKDD
jgi:hypothetical protein